MQQFQVEEMYQNDLKFKKSYMIIGLVMGLLLA